jgi:pyruvate dehydrogenase phosphatase
MNFFARHLLNHSTKTSLFLDTLRSGAYCSYHTQNTANPAFDESTSESQNDHESSESQNESRQEKNNNRSNQSNNSSTNIGIAAATLGFVVTAMERKLNKVSCFFGSGSKCERNKIKTRFASIQYNANFPIEDRCQGMQLESIDGYAVSVFDGHGGWQMAEFAVNNLHKELDAVLATNKKQDFASTEEYVKESIKMAYDNVEQRFLKICRDAYSLGFYNCAKVGSCAITAVIYEDKLYVANSGDCGAILCTQEDKHIKPIKLNQRFNAETKKEQQRLKSQFTDENIVVCKKTGKSCYVKNMLQPTRSFGDFRLKYKDFNKVHHEHTVILDFKGPYITHEPDIKVFDLTKKDKYLIMSSDGMWDELTRQDVATIVEKNIGSKETITTSLLDTALQTAAKRHNWTVEQLKKLEGKERRRNHDDMTIVVIDLENQGRATPR